ncbi:hypothetical protein QBC40DRAFT_256223 [Triangularia verruculosa]|uniref:Fucose-specific lectin n=1 Tax=Triangularia verruculosa TaxID=2587418 RepID=A0AAN7AT71_9PEZI|nr:hypothetical protein QBC40DRAFT_256223 [Triangularia verruculosa]
MRTYQSPYSDLPEAVPPRNDFPEVVFHGAPQAVERSMETVKYPVHAQVHNVDISGYDASAKEPPERRILGLKRKTFVILAIVGVIILIGIAVGTAVGVTMSQKSSSPAVEQGQGTVNDDSPSSSPGSNESAGPGSNESAGPGSNDSAGPGNAPAGAVDFSALPSNLSPTSAISSANFTDPNSGVVHLHVYSQSPENALLVSVWNSTARIWTTYSVSALLPSTYDLLPSTPISAYAYTNPTFQAGVLVLTSDFMLHQFVTTDVAMRSSWKHGPVGQDNAMLTVGRENRNFQLLRHQCGMGDDCRNYFPPAGVVFQDGEGMVWVFNVHTKTKREVGKGRKGGEVGLVSLVETGNERFNVSDIYWRVNFVPEENEGGELGSWTIEKGMSGEWEQERVALGEMPSKPAGHNMAVFSYDLVNQLIVTLEDGGKGLGVRTWEGVGNKWTLVSEDDDPAGLEDQKGNVTFTAVTGNSEKRVFGMVNGNIHEWRFSSGKPRDWDYVGRVSTSPVLTR